MSAFLNPDSDEEGGWGDEMQSENADDGFTQVPHNKEYNPEAFKLNLQTKTEVSTHAIYDQLLERKR